VPFTPTSAEANFARDEIAEIQRLLEQGEAATALARLMLWRPADRRQRIEQERLRAQASYMLGDESAALRHLVHALRSTSHLPEERIRVRANLADVLLRLGDTTRAERHARRAFVEIQLHGAARSQHPWLLSALA
jgi:hypothetical protein